MFAFCHISAKKGYHDKSLWDEHSLDFNLKLKTTINILHSTPIVSFYITVCYCLICENPEHLNFLQIVLSPPPFLFPNNNDNFKKYHAGSQVKNIENHKIVP